MERHRGEPRPGWEKIVEGQGMVYGIPGRGQGGAPRPYWDESVHYEFTMDEVLSLEADVELLHSMCLDAVEHVVTTERYRAISAMPECAWAAVAASWRRSDPHVYGRFDLRYDGSGPAKLLEYNADTPTTLLEAADPAVALAAGHVPERRPVELAARDSSSTRWREIRQQLPGDERPLHLVARPTPPARTTSRSLPAGDGGRGRADDDRLAIEDVGWDPSLERFVDLEERRMSAVFKLYPWEWVLDDEFGKHVLTSLPQTLWIEPLWKTMLSNKAMLAVLWEMYPGHPNLLPAYLDEPGMLTEYVRKPELGREGANIAIVAPGIGDRKPAASTATRATSTSSSTRCRSSTATGPRWARGSSATPRQASASARPSGWSPMTARPLFPTASPDRDVPTP